MVVPFVIGVTILAYAAIRAELRRSHSAAGFRQHLPALLAFGVMPLALFASVAAEHGFAAAMGWSLAVTVGIGGGVAAVDPITRARGMRRPARLYYHLYLFAIATAVYALRLLTQPSHALSLILPAAAALLALVLYGHALGSPFSRAKRRLASTRETPLADWKEGQLVKAVGVVNIDSKAEPFVESEPARVLLHAEGTARVEYPAAELRRLKRPVFAMVDTGRGRRDFRQVLPHELAKYKVASASLEEAIKATFVQPFFLTVGDEQVRIDVTRVEPHLQHEPIDLHRGDPSESKSRAPDDQLILNTAITRFTAGTVGQLSIEKQTLRAGDRIAVIGIARKEIRPGSGGSYRHSASSFAIEAPASGVLLLAEPDPAS
ncbi:MAG: hypothetical protein IPK60_05475 [Sandaracinaceae bacterium]|nr:hypothetical protein [Sandaracinaceae bacterium]